MRDVHCHILPGVDDGARDMGEALSMLEAARAAGITSMVCTPHCRSPYYDFEAMWRSYYAFEYRAGGFPLQMGFEVSHTTLTQLGLEWAEALCFDGTTTMLLELSNIAPPSRYDVYERTIYKLQGMGIDVIIAHPERYAAIQNDLAIAEELVDMGCELQVSADFMGMRRSTRQRQTASLLLRSGLCSYIASDAHHAEHYRLLARALRRYGHLLPR